MCWVAAALDGFPPVCWLPAAVGSPACVPPASTPLAAVALDLVGAGGVRRSRGVCGARH